jgi:hypothetical protein
MIIFVNFFFKKLIKKHYYKSTILYTKMGMSETKEIHETSTEGIDIKLDSMSEFYRHPNIFRMSNNCFIDKTQPTYNDFIKNHKVNDKVTVIISNERYVQTITKLVKRRAIINIANIVENQYGTYEIVYTNILYNGNDVIKLYCKPSIAKLLKNNESNEVIYQLERHDTYMIIDVLEKIDTKIIL